MFFENGEVIEEALSEKFELLCQDHHLTPYSYSGRGMFGAECFGISTPHIFSTLVNLTHFILTDNEMDDADKNELVKRLKQGRWDNMGLDYVIYFPSIHPT